MTDPRTGQRISRSDTSCDRRAGDYIAVPVQTTIRPVRFGTLTGGGNSPGTCPDNDNGTGLARLSKSIGEQGESTLADPDDPAHEL